MRDFAAMAREIRRKLLQMHAKANASHIASSFSCVEILIALYFSILRIFPEDPNHLRRDRFILSKGHAASALYATLAMRDLIPMTWLDRYHLDGSNLPGHPDRLLTPFCEASTGSLGHGLPMAVGMAYALKLNNNASRTFVLMSDGEIQEGSVWEAANAGSRLHLDNLIAIIDANGWQAYERTDQIMPIHTFKSKWKAFGWSVREVDGHHIRKMINVLERVPFRMEKPSILIAHTTKGKGIEEFENKLEWHYRSPRQEDLETYLKELDEKSLR